MQFFIRLALASVSSFVQGPPDEGGTGEVQPGHEQHVHEPEVTDRHEHHEHETDEALHGGRVRQVIVEVPTDGPDRPQVAGSDLDIDLDALSKVPRSSAEDLMTLAPGVALLNAGGENHPSTMYLRGFDAGEGQDIAFSVEGVPLNDWSNPHGHGFADTHFIIPELVTHLRFTQGSYDARQGDFAIAGSAGYSLGLEQRGYRVRGEYGRFNTARTLFLWGPEDAESGTFFGLDVRGGEGFGKHRRHLAGRMMAGYAHTFRRHTHLRVMAHSYGTHFESPTPLRVDDYQHRRLPCDADTDSQFYCTYNATPEGILSRSGISARMFRHDANRVFSQGIFLFHRSTNLREDFTGFALDPRGDGLDQLHRGWTFGARGSYGLRTEWRGLVQGLDFGYDLRWDTFRAALSRVSSDAREPYSTVFDNAIDVVNPGLYVTAPLSPTRWLDLNLGFRLDAWAVDVDRADPSEVDVSGGVLAPSPRVSTTVKIQPWLHWINGYGMGARSPDGNGLQSSGLIQPTRSHSAESGLRTVWTGLADVVNVDVRAVGFYTHVDRDLVFDPEFGSNQPVGETNRFGVLGTGRTTVAGWLDLQASVTWAEAYLPPPDAGAFAWTAGERLQQIPRITARLDAALWHGFSVRNEHFSWHFGAGVGHLSGRGLPLGRTGNPITVADLAGGVRWRWLELGLDVQNLLNARYREFEAVYASNFDGPAPGDPQLPMLHFVPGAPFSIMGSLTLHFEPGELTHFRKDREAAR